MQVSVVKNTATNYLVMLVRVFQGLLITRWLVGYLGDDRYGLWMLLWSFFGYAILVDFGFGIAAQKFTSLELFKRDIRRYNSIVSMVFSFQMLMSLVLLIGIFVASFYLPELLHVSDSGSLDGTPTSLMALRCGMEPQWLMQAQKLAYCTKCFYVFSLSSAIIFPLCIFSEIMTGLHKIYVKNYIDTASRICELIGFLIILKAKGGLLEIIIFDVILMSAERCFTGFCVSRFIPGFRIRIHFFDGEVFRQVFGFSSGTYFMSMAGLIRKQTRNPIISSFCGLGTVGIYNLAGRLSELCTQAIGQYNNNVRPVTAQLFHRGRYRMLRDFIVKSMQWNMFMCCLIIIPAILLREEAIFALFKKDVTREISLLSLLTLFSTAVWLAVTQIPSSVLLMCEKHHLLAWTSMAEAVAVISLNIVFLRAGYDVACIEIISLAASMVLFFSVRFPVMLRIIHGKALRELWTIFVPSLLAAVPGVVILLLCRKVLAGRVNDFLLCAICGIAYAVSYLAVSWQFLIGRAKKELWKRRVALRVRKILR